MISRAAAVGNSVATDDFMTSITIGQVLSVLIPPGHVPAAATIRRARAGRGFLEAATEINPACSHCSDF